MHTHTHPHTHTPTHTHTHAHMHSLKHIIVYLTVIGVHEMHGRMHPTHRHTHTPSPDDIAGTHNVRRFPCATVTDENSSRLDPDVLAKPVQEPVVATHSLSFTLDCGQKYIGKCDGRPVMVVIK